MVPNPFHSRRKEDHYRYDQSHALRHLQITGLIEQVQSFGDQVNCAANYKDQSCIDKSLSHLLLGLDLCLNQAGIFYIQEQVFSPLMSLMIGTQQRTF